VGSSRSLARVDVDTATSEDRLRTILELTKSFTFLVDIETDEFVRVERVSDSFTRDFGYTVEDLRALGAGALAIVYPEDLPRALATMQQLVAGEQPRAELRAVAKDGSVRWVRVYCTTESVPGGAGPTRLFGVGQDVTEEVETREAVSANAARLAAFFEQSPIGQAIITAEGNLVAVNGALCELTGYGPEDLIGGLPAVVVHPTVVERAKERFRRILRTGSADRVDFDSLWVTKEGRTIEVALTLVPERDADGRPTQWVIAVQDVTERNRAHEERQILLERVVEAHAEERVRLARELHDGLGQLLTSASLYATSIEEQAPEALVASLATLRGQLGEALAATRTLVWRLRPAEIDERGVAGAVVTLVEKIRQRHHVQVDVHIGGLQERLPAQTESAIYRVVQEAVTNAVKHADPQTISILITRRRSAIVALIEDDGAGFVLQSVVARDDLSGFGIVGMRERAVSVGGRLVIESRPGNGTMVRLEVPCEE
jgi:PAS domain S-box-containing protein